VWCVHSVSCAGARPKCTCRHASRREAEQLLLENLAVTIRAKHLRLLPAERAEPEAIKGQPIPATVEHISGGRPVLGPFVTFSEQGRMHDAMCFRCSAPFTTDAPRRRFCNYCAATCSACEARPPYSNSLRGQLCDECVARWCRCGTRITGKRKRLCDVCHSAPRARFLKCCGQIRWCKCGERLREKRKRLCRHCRSIPRKRMQDAKKVYDRVDIKPA
jgi:hypothetical protein